MTYALIITACILFVAVLFLLVKLIILTSDLRNINMSLPEILQGGTNKLLTLGSGDSSIKSIVLQLNKCLSKLRTQELKYENGDRELKTALTNAAHDLRTPLTAIQGYLDLLESETDPSVREKYLDIIRERTGALKRLSEELFVYSVTVDSSGTAEARLWDAGNVLKECLADFYETFCAKQIVPEINIASPSFNIAADKLDLIRMFSNIISNALKYSAGDFKVVTGNKKITFGNTAANVDALDVNRLFDRFYTVKSGKSSTGIGLSIAKIICERLGGKISAALNGSYLEICIDFESDCRQIL